MSIVADLDRQAPPNSTILYVGWNGNKLTSFDADGNPLTVRSARNDDPKAIQAVIDHLKGFIEDPIEDWFDRHTIFVDRPVQDWPTFIGCCFEMTPTGRADSVMFFDCTYKDHVIHTVGEDYMFANKYWIYLTRKNVSTDLAFSDACR